MTGPRYRIGELARAHGITLRALRFYQEKDLLRPDREGVTRLYNQREADFLEIAIKCRRAGIGLPQVKELREMFDAGKHAAIEPMVKNFARRRICELEDELDAVRKLKPYD